MGRKRAKTEDAKTDLCAKKVKIAEATLNAQEERNDLLKYQQEMNIFTCTYDASDPVVNEYITTIRKRALESFR